MHSLFYGFLPVISGCSVEKRGKVPIKKDPAWFHFRIPDLQKTLSILTIFYYERFFFLTAALQLSSPSYALLPCREIFFHAPDRYRRNVTIATRSQVSAVPSQIPQTPICEIIVSGFGKAMRPAHSVTPFRKENIASPAPFSSPRYTYIMLSGK